MAITKDQVSLELEIDTKAAVKGLADIETSVSGVSKAIKDLPSSPYEKLNKQSKDFAAAIKQQNSILKKTENELKLFGKTGSEAIDIQTKAQIELINARKNDIQFLAKTKSENDQLNKIFIKQIRAVEELANAKKDAEKTNITTPKKIGLLKKLNSNIIKTSLAVTGLSQGMQIASMAFRGLSSSLSSAIRPFANLQTNMIAVAKTADLDDQAVQNLTNSFVELSKKMPVTANELARIATIAGQLGIKGKDDLTLFAETIAKVVRSTDLGAEQAATSLTRILAVTKESVSEVDVFASVLVRLGNNVKATESQIISVTNEVARATTIFGVSAAEAVALSAAMAEINVAAENAGSTMFQTFSQINKAVKQGGKELIALEKITGMSGVAFKEVFAKNAVEGFKIFIDGLSNLDPRDITAALEEFGLTGIRVNKVLAPLAKNSQGLKNALALAKEELKDATSLNKEAERSFTTLNSKLNILGNSFSSVFQALGEKIEPLVIPAIEAVSSALSGLGSFLDSLSSTSFAAITLAITAFSASLLGLIPAVTAVLPALAAFAKAILLNPLFLKAAIIGGGIVVLVKAFNSLSASVSVLNKSLEGLFVGFFEIFKLFTPMNTQIKELNKGLGNSSTILEKLFDIIRLSIAGVSQVVGTFVLLLLDSILKIKELFGVSSSELENLKSSISKLENSLAGSTSESDKILSKWNLIDKQISSVVKNAANVKSPSIETGSSVSKASLDPSALEKTKNIIAAIKESLRQSTQELQNFGLTGAKAIDAQVTSQVELLKKREQEALLLAKTLSQIKQIKDLTASEISVVESLGEKRKEALSDETLKKLIAGNEQLLVQGMNAEEQAEYRKRLQLEQVNELERELQVSGLLTEEMQAQLDFRRELINPKDNDKGFIEALTDAAKKAGGVLVSFASEAFSAASQVFSAGAEVFSSVASMAGPAMAESLNLATDNLVLGLSNVAGNASATITSAIDSFVAITNALPQIIADFMSKLPMIIDKLFLAAINFLEKLPAMVASIVEKLPELISSIFDKLPMIIEKLFLALPEVISILMSKIPEILVSVLDRLPMILEKLITGIVGSMGEIVVSFIDVFIVQGGALKIALALVKGVVKAIPAIVKGIFNGLRRALKSLFGGRGGLKIKLPSVKPLEKSVEKVFKKVTDGATKVSEKLFGAIDLPTAKINANMTPQEVVDEITPVIDATADLIGQKNFDFLAKLKETWMWVWDNIFSPIGEFLKRAVQGAFMFVEILFNSLIKIVKVAFEVVGFLWNGFIDIVHGAFAFVEFLWNAFKAIVKNAFVFVENLWNGFKQIVELAFEDVKKFWEGFKGLIDNAFSGIKAFFESISRIFKPIFDPLVAAFEKISKPFEDLANALSSFKMPSFGGGGGDGGTFGKLSKKIGFADGGLVGGVFDGTDNQFIAAQPGEFVMSRSATSRIGAENLSAMNKGSSVAGGVTINFGPGAIQIGENANSEAIVDEIVESLRRRSLDGDFVIATEGIRAS